MSLEGGDMTWGDIDRAENGGPDDEERGYISPFDDVADIDDVPQVPHDTWRDIEEAREAEDLQGSLIVAPTDGRESVAIVSVVLSPGQSVPMGPPFRFEGWLHDRAQAPCTCGGHHQALMLEEPTRFHVEQEGTDAYG